MSYAIRVDGEYQVEYRFDLVQNLDDSGELPAVTFATNKPVNNQVLAFQGQMAEVPVTWIIYDTGTDASKGTLASSGIVDSRLYLGDGSSEAVAAEDKFRVSGHIADRVETSGYDDVRVEGTNQGTYTVSSTDEVVESGVNYTDIYVSGSVGSDATGEELYHNVRTVQEQIVFLKHYVFSPQFGTKWWIEGGRFDNPEGGTGSNGTPVVMKQLDIRETADAPLRAEADVSLEVGEVI